jgi:hypothetical protein
MPSTLIKSVTEPPTNHAPVTEYETGQQHSTEWTEYFQTVTDKINELVNRANTLPGVTDGSDAPAGVVGEVMTASGSAGLSHNALVTVASLTLTAGDWHVWGYVTFTLTSAVSNHYVVTIDGEPGTEIVATVPTGSGTWRLQSGTVRRNYSVSITTSLLALAGFTSGSITASGTLNARRMR